MTQKKIMLEVLSAHAEQLLKNQNRSQDYISLFPENEDLPPLLSLAGHIKEALQPVTLPPSFKAQLQKDLMAAAHLRQVRRAGRAGPHLNATRISLFISAGVGAILALTGIVFFIRKQRRMAS